MQVRWTRLRRTAGVAIFACGIGAIPVHAATAAAPAPTAVIAHFADMAEAIYGDALLGARSMETSIDAFLARPTPQSLAAARAAWKAARIPYLQSEGFRFANLTVDALEPRINAWPLDEGLIDYVAPSYGTQSDENPLYAANAIATTRIRVGAKEIDAAKIDKGLLRQLQQAEGVQTNVSTGYHAIEFLLWGQNLHGEGPHSGERPASDYDLVQCTHSNCGRRAAYLKNAAALLVDDLQEMTADWRVGGKARVELMAKGPEGGLSEILTGLGSLSFGEMAGERMKIGLMLHDPKEAQDCFSNNTHNSHYYDEIGITELWRGQYVRGDGRTVDGPGMRAYAMAADTASAQLLDQRLGDALAKIEAIRDTAESGHMEYDQMLVAGNVQGNALIQNAMDALVAQTRAIEALAASLHLKISSDKTAANSASFH